MFLSSSMICTDLLNMGKDIAILEKNKIDYFHFDIADGDFLPRFGLSSPTVKAIRKVSAVPFDFHFKVERPEKKMNCFDMRAGDIACFHPETISYDRLAPLCEELAKKGIKPAIAIYPSAPFEGSEKCLPHLYMFLLMPKGPDRKLVGSFDQKIEDAKNFLAKNKARHVVLGVDGECTFETIPEYEKQGIGLVVCGTGSLFNEGGLENNLKHLQKLIKKGDK